MNERPSNSSKVGGVNQLTKDRFEILSKTVAIIGGIVSALALIWTLNESTVQKKLELRRNQSRLGMELVDAILSDTQTFDALRMVDWNRRIYQVGKNKQVITTEDVRIALDIQNSDHLSEIDVFIREHFDELFYHMEKIERCLRVDLIQFEDIQSPLDYYLPIMYNKYRDVLDQYMQLVGHKEATALLIRFEAVLPNAFEDGSRPKH